MMMMMMKILVVVDDDDDDDDSGNDGRTKYLSTELLHFVIFLFTCLF